MAYFKCSGAVVTPTLINKSISANGTYNASSDNADGYSSVTVEIEGVVPVFSGISYGYLGTDGKFYSNNNANSKLDVFEVPSGTVNTVALLANPNKNRGRVCFFANMIYSDFSEYILNPHVNEAIYTASENVIMMDNIPYLVNSSFRASQAGILIAVTNNTRDTSTKAILGSLNVNQ